MPQPEPPALPTRERLITIAEAAERRPLSAGEFHDLRLGITHLAAQLGGAGNRIRKLTADLAQARRERDEARQALAFAGDQAVPCGYCHEPAGRPCRAQDGELMAEPHTARAAAAGRALWLREAG